MITRRRCPDCTQDMIPVADLYGGERLDMPTPTPGWRCPNCGKELIA